MQLKPPRWNVSPALIAPEARGLWKGTAFVLPCFAGAHLGGGGLLLGPAGAPLRNANLTAGSAAQQRATPYGYGIGLSGASNLLQKDNYEPITTSDGAGTGDFTILVLANPIAEARISDPLNQSTATLGVGAGIRFNEMNNGAQSGTVSFRTRSGGAGTNTSLASAIDGAYHLFAARRLSTEIAIYLDGVKRASVTGTARAVADGTLGLGIGQSAEGTGNRIDTGCNIVFAAGWNRALSDAEIRLLARDPFTMFRPYPEWRGVWTPPGGNAVLSPSDLLLAPAFETPAISQNHFLVSTEMALAESIESAGFFQAHGLPASELNFAFLFGEAALAMDTDGAPGFRTRKSGASAAVKITGTVNRGVQPQNGGRRKSITE